MRPWFILLLLALLLAPAAQAGEDDAWRGDNPRNQRWEQPVIEWVEVGPSRRTLHLRHPGTDWITLRVGGEWGAVFATLEPGRRAAHTILGAPPREVLLLRESFGDVVHDRYGPIDDLDLTVGLLIERRTLDEGDRRFGSFVRRMRKSFRDLSAFLAARSVSVRFRIQHVDVYDRDEEERPALFDDHPELDLVIACDEGGPLAGFSLPQYSIGHNFAFGGEEEEKPKRGLWSTWGEQALWHELLHFRGVPDSYIFHLPVAALPGRATKGVPLPDRFKLGLMNSPYQEPRISDLTAAILNAKQGIRRVGACEEPDHEHGHMWRWVPARIALDVQEAGKSLENVPVRWWRSRPMEGLGDPRRQGVPAGTSPDVEGASEIDAALLGRSDPRLERSLFLLVEVEHEGATRWDVIRLLELNEAWAAGHHDRYTHVLDWDAMKAVGR